MDAVRDKNVKKHKEIKYRERSAEEKNKLLDEKDKKNTQVATEHAVMNFCAFLKAKQQPAIKDLDQP